MMGYIALGAGRFMFIFLVDDNVKLSWTMVLLGWKASRRRNVLGDDAYFWIGIPRKIANGS